ncbi:YkgJ family cysteine cluster protein [Deinococcus roseus]|uniref:Zinc/iron-chelating domain-containing protein n=1 Tax=Deinococcus roseus TaxID=392414 RepID=A0ABQ2CUC5_9DEIO|nr:YkgJ family cysteine cluster protein [Deinococcus roseus]GGJ21702.1 hypothetical protein GCM10008938_04870 [Deinococcus roseus]
MNQKNITKEVRKAYQKYDDQAKRWIEDYTAQEGRIYCQAGCFKCCDMPIRISWAEALTISESLTEEQFARIQRHANKVWVNAHKSKTSDEYAENHRKFVGFCPLLDRASGGCTLYGDRPIRCRDTYSGMPAHFCGAGALEKMTPPERKQYQRIVRSDEVFDGYSHYIAPLEDLSMPAWNRFSLIMKREMGVQIWGDFWYLVTMTRNADFAEALTLKNKRKVVQKLQELGLYHEEIVQVE